MQRERERRGYGGDVLLSGDGVEEVEIDEAELLKFVDQLDDIPLREAHAGLDLLRQLELPLEFEQLRVHLDGSIGSRTKARNGERKRMGTKRVDVLSSNQQRDLPTYNARSLEFACRHLKPKTL